MFLLITYWSSLVRYLTTGFLSTSHHIGWEERLQDNLYFVSSRTFNINSIKQRGQWNVKRCLLNSLCKRVLSNMFHGVCMYALRGTFAKLYACRSHLRSFYSLVDWEPTPCVRMRRSSANTFVRTGAQQTLTVTNVVMMEKSTASIH